MYKSKLLTFSFALACLATSGFVACAGSRDPTNKTSRAEHGDDQGDEDQGDCDSEGKGGGHHDEGDDDMRVSNLQRFRNPSGYHATYSTRDGRYLDTGNPFFRSLGANGRTCASCHAVRDGLSISAAHVRQLFRETCGLDPLFRFDGATNPNADMSTFARRREAFSLLLNKGLILIQIPIPPNAEFELIDVDDPYGNDLSRGLVMFRRPLTATNLTHNNMIMWDGREPDLISQARNATLRHAQATASPSDDDLRAIVALETALSTTQVIQSPGAGNTSEQGANGDPVFLSTVPFVLDSNRNFQSFPLDILDHNVFSIYSAWAESASEARQAVARGQVLFNTKDMINPDTGVHLTCSNCHNAFESGSGTQSLARAPLFGVMASVHVSNPEFRTPDLPLYTLRNKTTGEIKQTTDPGLALIDGTWGHIGSFKAPRLRGLSAHAPFFHNGMSATLRDVVEHYDVVFRMGMTEQEKSDMDAFLRAL